MEISPPWAVEDEEHDLHDESALVAAAQADPSAFEVLYRRYLPRIYRYLHARVGHVEEAADLTQQVFVQALRALPKYQHRGVPFAAWLFRIARNVANDYYRRHRSTVTLDILPESIWATDSDSPERIILLHEELERMQRLYLTLDDSKRELLTLRFAAELRMSEIAVVVGKREATVRQQIRRILARLKEQMNDG